MCVNQKCMPVADLRAQISGGNACPNGCNGNGICNSLGHCHCNRGFRPPDCILPGVGGSEDSGPAEDPNGKIKKLKLQLDQLVKTILKLIFNFYDPLFILQRETILSLHSTSFS